MKKITKSFFIVMLFVAMAIGIVACDKSAKITGIYVDTDETTIYIKHKSDWDPLEFLTVKAKLDNGSEKDIKIDSCTFSGLDVNEVGEQTLVITYGAYECTLDVEVYKYVTDIEVQQWPNNQVDHNGTLDTSNIKICVYYSDLTSDEDVTDGFTVGTAPTNEVGRHDVTITYTDAHNETASCTYEYRVNAVLQSLTLNHDSYANSIKWTSGADTYNYSDLRVTANYSDGTSLPVNADDLTFDRKITTNVVNAEDYFVVRYGGRTVQSNPVNVYVDYESLEVAGLPTSIEFGTELNLTSATASAVFTNGTSETVNVDDLVIDCDFRNLGDTTITVSYTIGGTTKTYTYNINVFEQFKGAIIAQPVDPLTSKYFVVGDEFDGSRFKYYEVWSKTNREIDITKINFVNAEAATEPTTKTVTVKYTKDGYDTPFTTTIEVVYVASNDQIPNVSITSAAIESGIPAKVAHKGTLDTSNLKIRVNYSNGESVVMDYDEDEMDCSFSASEVGNQPITITYKDVTARASVPVIKTLDGIEINRDSIRVLYNANSTIDFTGIMIKLKYSTGEALINAASGIDKSFAMDKDKLAATHSYTQDVVFTFTPNDCYDNTPKTTILPIEIYEEAGYLYQEGLSDIVRYSTTDNYADKNTNMKVYLVYTSNNKDLVTLATESSAGYKVDKDIDLSKVGYQSFIISYYTYDATNGHQKVDGFTVSKEVVVEDYIIDYTIAGLQDVYKQSSGIDIEKCYLVPVYASGAEASRLSHIKTGFETNYDAQTQLEIGEYSLNITYLDKIYTKIINIVANYEIKMFEAPEFVTLYKNNSNRKNEVVDGVIVSKGFTELGKMYTVGNDNAFKFEPIVKAKIDDNETSEITDYTLTADIYRWVKSEGEDAFNYLLIEDSEKDKYVKFDPIAHKFEFTDNAINNQFKIVVGLDGYTVDSKIEFEFRVVDGFNVYTAAELSVLDNSNVTTAFNGTKVGTKWNDFKAKNGISSDIRTNAIILHSNINVTRDDVPDVHFFKPNEINSGDIDYNRVVGSLKDSKDTDPNDKMHLQFIYLRTVESGKSFNIEGNYFQISFDEFPLMVRADDGTATGKVSANEDDAITTHTAVFGFVGSNTGMTAIMDEVADATYVPGTVNISNTEMLGNAKKTDVAQVSGGVTGYKAQYVNFNATNNLTQACYIAYFARGLDRTNSTLDEANKYDEDGTLKTNIAMRLNKVNAYDSYNTLLYLWGTSKVYIDSSNFIGAGGPVMICDHAEDNKDHGGYTTNVYIDYNKLPEDNKTVLQSWVAGSEGWFKAYEGAVGAATMLKQLDKMLRLVESMMRQQPGCSDITLPTILKDGKINIVAVFKSGTVEGISTAEIQGSFKVYGYNGLDFSDPEVIAARQATAAANALCVMQSNNVLNADGSNNCTFMAPGDGNLAYQDAKIASLAACQDYMNVYLYNGMAAVLGLG